MLHLHFSNRLELLREQLLQRLADRSGDGRAAVFNATPVIVPHAALRRSLSLAIADAQGVCANLQFGFLASWLWQLIARVVPGVADSSPFDAAHLAWRAYRAFGDADFVGAHPRLSAYLQDADPVLRHELALRVAGLLESYVTYRSDWLRAWRDGRTALPLDAPHPDEAWQAALWRRIDADMGLQALHPAQAFAMALQQGGPALAQRAGLPSSAHVFALPGIAPLHLQLLQVLAQVMDLHLYVLNPCQEYWFDVVGPRRLARLAAAGRAAGHDEGNRLLASWGTATQAHVAALVELLGETADDEEHFEPAGGHSLLQRLQNAVLELQPIEPGSLADYAGDRSVELHVCHSLTRELEVLQDHLLGLFDRSPGTQPSDILVVLPHLDRAAPLIDAVFGTVPIERRIPYTVAGRLRSTQNPTARALLALLALAASRCAASEVFALLQQPLVARRFGLDDDALAQLHDALRDAGFRWALDARHLAGFDVPATPRHTLDDALQRLFLGHVLPEGADEPFEGLLGAGHAEGSRALALGAFWQFSQSLRQWQLDLQAPRGPAAWAAAWFEMLEAFTKPKDADLDDQQELHAAIRQVVDDMRGGGLGEDLPLPVAQAALQRQLDDPARSAAGGGNVTFASMSSQRGLPYAVVCVLGLNDGEFPGTAVPLEFDLMAQAPRRGDRQPRQDERALMLDLLLAARRQLYLSHTGRSVRDNSSLPPSVLVSELIDLLQPALAGPGASPQALQAARASWVVEHPLQAFSPVAFDIDGDVRLRSYNAELAEALRHRAQLAQLAPNVPLPAAGVDVEVGAEEADDEDADDSEDAGASERAAHALAPAAPFFGLPLAEAEATWREPGLDQLIEFFRNPARYLLRRRLGVALPREADALIDDESFVPDARERAALARRLLPHALRGADGERLEALARAGTEVPDGALGDIALQRELLSLQQFAERLQDAGVDAVLPPLSQRIELEVDGQAWALQCHFQTLRPKGLLGWRYGPSRAGDYLDAWLQHLALCAAAPAHVAPHTHWLSADGDFSLRRCDDAAAQLAALLGCYRQGLREPLPFYPRSAWALIVESRSRALAAWRATADRPFGEEADPAYRLALRGVVDPLDGRFEALAARIFEPLLKHLDDTRLVR